MHTKIDNTQSPQLSFNLPLRQNKEFKIDQRPEISQNDLEAQNNEKSWPKEVEVFSKNKNDSHGNFEYCYYPKMCFRVNLIQNPKNIFKIFGWMLILNIIQMFILISKWLSDMKFTTSATFLIIGYGFFENYRAKLPVVEAMTLGDRHIYQSVMIAMITMLLAYAESFIAITLAFKIFVGILLLMVS